ncbi:hypothetical protein PybrP1_012827 [[Pythium] brassicae (nom. inval.)]|nr:hypothetical protein PybrP1_012827 [[Pythium] brassicae (nom. inval.)]
MATKRIDFAIPLQSNCSTDEPSSLPSSPTAADADLVMELPYVTPSYSLAIQSKRALAVRNALVASKFETLLRTIEENASGGAAVEKDEFIEMVRLLPALRSGEAFRPIEETLERIYRSFEAANRVDLYLLGIGCLPLLHGSAKEKLDGAIKLSLFGCGVPMDDPISLSVLKTALACLLLAVTSVFDLESATPAQLQSTATIVTTSVSEVAARLHSFYALGKDATSSFEPQIWPWVETNAGRACPWLKFVDQRKWPTTKRLSLSPTKSDATNASSPRRWTSEEVSLSSSQEGSAGSGGESQATTAGTSASLDQPALSFRFASADGAMVTIGEEQATKLFHLLTQSAFTKIHPKVMYDTFVQHTGDGLLEEETFLEAIEELLSMTNVPHLSKDSDFLDGMIDIFRCFLPEKVLRVDAFEIAAGFSLFTWGSKSDKLGSAFHYFDADSKGFLNQQQLWRFLRSVLTILLYLSPPNAMILQRHGSLAALVDTGEEEIVESIMEGLDEEYGDYDDDDDDDEDDDGGEAGSENGDADERELANAELRAGAYTFEDFGLWYNSGGHKNMSWLELLDLRKWMFVSPAFDVEQLDVQPVDPVYASSNYYTANNIQVDVDADNIDDLKVDGKNHFTFAEMIVEEEDEDDADPPAPPLVVNAPAPDEPSGSESSFSSSSSAPNSHDSSSPSTLPAFVLKSEVVLEFDLVIDPEDDTVSELPLTTLSFNNGDLLMYAELQRVTKLHQVDLNRVYEVFSPMIESPGYSSIEKSTFDRCVRQLLPRDVGRDVAAAFGVHTNTRVPPPSVGRGNESKMAADTLSRLFFAFNRGGTGKIDLVEFVSAFSMFCAGSKSQKLGYAYSLFDSDHDGSLTRREMWKYLRSFLTMLLALGNGSELSAEAIASVADTTAIQIADTIFRDSSKTFSVRRNSPRRRQQGNRHSLDALESVDRKLLTTNRSRRDNGDRNRYEHRGSLPDDDSISLTGAARNAAGAGAGNAFIRGGVVSFQEFATWYSTRGHIIIAWIELLDTKKWPEVNPTVADAILRYISRQQQVILPGRVARANEERDSGSSNDTESSNDSNHRRNGGMFDAGYPDTNMTIISAADLRTGNVTTALERMDGIGGIADLISSPPTSSAAIKDLSSVALQFKLMNFDNTTLRIRLKDVAIVYTISERMNMSSMTCRDMVNLLNKYAQGRTLTKQGFLRAMRDLVPRDVLSNEDQEFLSFHLLRIYTLFETESALNDESGEGGGSDGAGFLDGQDAGANGSSSVDKLLILSGLSIFCGTTKSAKLGTLFKVFDTQGKGYVSRRHLYELLKSILVALFAFSSYNASKTHANDTATTNSASTNSVAERAAGAVIAKLFCEAKCRHKDVISLAEFAAWYAAGGYMDCPWLELLDLSKWPAKEAFEASKREKPLIYAFDMQDEGNILNFTETDMSTYLFVLRSTNLSETSVSKIYDSLLAYATPPPEEGMKKKTAGHGKSSQAYSYAGVEEDEGAYLVISRSNFYECIRSLVKKDGMSEKAQQTSSKLLSRIFNVFDRKRCGRVNALELACGMSILGKGSKSQKLALAFDFIAKMRQQRTRTLNVYASNTLGGVGTGAGAGGVGGLGGGGLGGFAFGINSISTGGPGFGLPSVRGGAGNAAMRRTAMQNEPNGLPHSVLFIYLRSFLLALMALSDGTYRLGIEKMHTEAEDVIEEAMGDLMTDVSATGSNAAGAAMSTNGFAGYGSVRSRACVTFEQFGEWYNTGGYQIISWVELLDVSKWQQEQDFQEQTTTSLAGVGTGRVMSKRVAVLGSQRPGHYPVPASATPILEHVQPIESYYSTKPITQMKQVRQSEIVSTSYANGVQTAEARGAGKKSPPARDPRDSITAASLCSDGPIMVFFVARRASEIHFFHEDIARLKQFLHQTQLHQLAARTLGPALQSALSISGATTAALVTRSHFIQSVELVCSNRPDAGSTTRCTAPPPPVSLSDDSMELLDQVLGVFVREPEPVKSGSSAGAGEAEDASDGSDLLEFGAAVCGLLVVCEGSLLEKLTCAAQVLEDGLASDRTQPVVMETLKSALMCFLMAFYGMSSSLTAEIARFSAELGAEEVLRSFEASFGSGGDDDDEEESKSDRALDLAKLVSLQDFSEWFSDAGYHSHPWLELTELEHWPAAINMGRPDTS